VRGNMPPKLTVASLAKELADLKQKLANGGAAADAADPGTALVIVDTEKPTEDPAEVESTILTTAVKGWGEVWGAFRPWAKDTLQKTKTQVVQALKDNGNVVSDTPTAAPKLEDNPLKNEVVQLQQQQATMMDLMQQQATMMQAFMKQHQTMQQQSLPQAPPRFTQNQQVWCTYYNPGHKHHGSPYGAIVTAVNDDDTYDVQFTLDKEIRLNVPHNELSVNSKKRPSDVESTNPTKTIKCEPSWSDALKAGKLNMTITPLPSVDELRTHRIDATDLYSWMVLAGFRCGRAYSMTKEELLKLRSEFPNRERLKQGERVVWE
jgi:hypothetical protein